MATSKKFGAFKNGALLVAAVAVAAAMLGNPTGNPNADIATHQGTEQAAEADISPARLKRQGDNIAFLAAQDGQSHALQGLDKARQIQLSQDYGRLVVGGVTVNYHVDADRMEQAPEAKIALLTTNVSDHARAVKNALNIQLVELLKGHDMETIKTQPTAIADALVNEIQADLDRSARGASALVVDSVEMSNVCGQVFNQETAETTNTECDTITSSSAEVRASQGFGGSLENLRATKLQEKSKEMTAQRQDIEVACRTMTCG